MSCIHPFFIIIVRKIDCKILFLHVHRIKIEFSSEIAKITLH